MPSQVSFKGNWDVTNDTSNDVVNIQHDNGGQFQFVTDGTVQELNGGDGVSFKFDEGARTAKFVNADGTDAFVVNDGGRIDAHSELNLNGNNLYDVENISHSGNQGYFNFYTAGIDGTHAYRFRDGYNGQDLLVVNEGGPVEVLNAKLDVSGNGIIAGQGANINTGSGGGSGGSLDTSGSGSSFWSVFDAANSQKLMQWNEGGPVEVLNTDLNLRQNRVVNFKRGSSSELPLQFYGGAGFYVDGSGEIVGQDEAGNTTTLT